jgi:hypothetical protein
MLDCRADTLETTVPKHLSAQRPAGKVEDIQPYVRIECITLSGRKRESLRKHPGLAIAAGVTIIVPPSYRWKFPLESMAGSLWCRDPANSVITPFAV